MSGPKSDTATIEARKNRLMELLAEGKSQVEAAEIMRLEDYPASLRTVQEDIRKLRGHWRETNKESFAESVANQVEVHLRVIEELWTGIMPADTGNAIKGHLEAIAKLTGRNAPTKHITARVDAEKITQGFYAEFARRTIKKFKHQASWQRLWDWIEAQPSDYEEEDRLLLEAHDENV